ncbi:nucleotidyltransferase [Nocardiopsis sp. CNR-923]|nr:nucleotidyltransferase [Nocardiopsis sp. CNR-923]
MRGSAVGRYYGAEVTVVEDGGRPARFTWNGRVYGVRRILDHWVTVRMDWSPASTSEVPERRHWRVEAGTAHAQGVYELRHDTSTGEWLLSRVWD